MRKLPILILALFAVFAFSVVVVATASAEGPVWIVLLLAPENLMVLGAGESEAFSSTGGKFTLDGVTNIECASEKDSGEIIGNGGVLPGTGKTTIEFEKCNVVGAVNCLASNTGVPDKVLVEDVKTMLVYPDTSSAPNATEALNAFFPLGVAERPNQFVEFKLLNAIGATEHLCMLLNGTEVLVEAVGDEINSPINLKKKCGVLALVGKLNGAGNFVATVGGEEALTGAIESSGVTEALTLVTTTTYTLINCLLEAFEAAAEELGISDITLNSGDEFGWAIK